jgi:8-oxo-dGTP diphosphatase
MPGRNDRRNFLIAVALVHRGEEVLLVRQQGPHDAESSWALPGGVVETGELLTEAVVREVMEETGLEILDVGRLLYTTQFDNPAPLNLGDGYVPQPYQTTTFVFDIKEWRGDLQNADPEHLVQEARFLSVAEAIQKLELLPRRVMREPILAHLRGETNAGVLWIYRRDERAGDELVARL